MAGRPAWVAAAGLHGLVLVVPSAGVSLATGFGSALPGAVALATWVAGTAGEDAGVGVERAVSRFEQARALMLLGYLWVVGLGGAAPVGGRLFGFALVVAGLGLRRWAIRSLGPRFRAALHGTGPWVHTGPYAFAHHPSEFGLALATLGVAWMAGSMPALLVWPVLVGLPAGARVWMEDRAVGRMGLS
jgi:hypothetical protein